IDFQDKLVFFRHSSIRNAAVPLFARQMMNIIAAVGKNLDGVIAPKVDTEEDVRTLDRILTRIEIDKGGDEAGYHVGRMLIESLIEKPQAAINLDEIAAASPRLAALIFGLVDDIAATGGRIQHQPFRYQLYPL